MKTLSTLIALTFLLSLPLSSEAKKKRGGEGNMKKIMAQLNLSEEQKTQLKEMRKENKKMPKANGKSMKEAREKMKEKFASNAPESELRALHEEISKLKAEKADKRFNRLMKMRNILTLEQRAKFQELRK